MSRWIRILVFALIAVGASQVLAAPVKVWTAPTCSPIRGIPSVGYTTDDLVTLTDNTTTAGFGIGTHGLIAFEQAGLLLAEYGGTIFRSRDGGCKWSRFTTTPDGPLRMVRGAGTRAYGWSFVANRGFYRIDAAANGQNRFASSEKGAPSEVVMVAPDPANPDRVRMAGQNGQIYESFDGGELWGPVGTSAKPAGVTTFVYFAAFDPVDPNHVVFGLGLEGVRVTTDGGLTWTTATGLSATGGQRNAFNGVISPADSSVVYVMSLDLDAPVAEAKNIYRSEDGGFSFTPVVGEGPDLTLINGPLMVAHPTDPNVVYSSFGARVFDSGTYLYKYDHATGTVTINKNTGYFGIRAIEFNPADPAVLYLGLEG
jgi:hypothetical protein